MAMGFDISGLSAKSAVPTFTYRRGAHVALTVSAGFAMISISYTSALACGHVADLAGFLVGNCKISVKL